MKLLIIFPFLILSMKLVAHDVKSVEPGVYFDSDNEQLFIGGKWNLTAGPGRSSQYPAEHSVRILCTYSENECVEAVAAIYTPAEHKGFKVNKLYPWFRKYSIVENNENGLLAKIEGKAGTIVFRIDQMKKSICITDTQTIDNKDGTRPIPSTWCLDMQANQS